MNLICLVVDRLQTGMLGAYGNTWIHTPQFDRLASTSFLFDQAFADDVRLDRVYRALWRGLHTLAGDEANDRSSTLIERLAASGMQTTLLTDEQAVYDLPLAATFAERECIEPPVVERLARELHQTQLANFFAAASDWLANAPDSFCLWLHTRGLAGAWDAPIELRQQYADPEDPPSPDFTRVPQADLADDADPDIMLGISHAYAAQVSLLDTCLGALLDELGESGLAKNTLLVLLSARGFALGEHRRVGIDDERLHSESTHLAMMLCFPDGQGAAARTQALVQPADLPATILAALELPPLDHAEVNNAWNGQSLLPLVSAEVQTLREALISVSPAESALRTTAWLLKKPLAEGGVAELYARPGDRHEVNEVADRCPEIASSLEDLLAKTLQNGQFPSEQLAEPLTAPLD